jgi:hypothetical protein
MTDTTPQKDKDPYRLLVKLAEFTPLTASPGDWLNFQASLAELAQLVGQTTSLAIVNIGNPIERQELEATLRPIHTHLRRLVRQHSRGPITAADTGNAEGTPVSITDVRITALPLDDTTVALLGRRPPRFIVGGRLRDVAIFATVLLLTQGESRAPIAMCPEDGRLFVRSRRQRYCSRRCVTRVNARTHRAALLAKIAKKQAAAKKKPARKIRLTITKPITRKGRGR